MQAWGRRVKSRRTGRKGEARAKAKILIRGGAEIGGEVPNEEGIGGAEEGTTHQDVVPGGEVEVEVGVLHKERR